MGLDIGELAAKAQRFENEMQRLKRENSLPGQDWYRYDSMPNIEALDALLTGERRDLAYLAGGLPVADIGCADGELSFFFERLGLQVDAIDNPGTAQNQMAGVRRMRELLHSSIGVRELDLDSRFELPRAKYGLALLLGVLYHLKNPFYAAEHLARHARYCLLSTRVTRTIPGIQDPVEHISIAYLLGEAELNRDVTNYWIFTQTGLRRMLLRAGWCPLEWTSVGRVSSDSDPTSQERDERVFCLLASRHALQHLKLVEGFYEPEEDGWRWTAQRFSAVLPSPPGLRGPAELRLDLYLPPVVLEKVGAPTLRACSGGVDLGELRLDRDGIHRYARQVEVPGPDGVRVDFELDRAMPPQGQDVRTLGVVVQRLDLER